MVGGHSVYPCTNENASKEQEGLDPIVSNGIRSQKDCSEIRFEPEAGRAVGLLMPLKGMQGRFGNEGIEHVLGSLFVGCGFVSFVRRSCLCPEQAERGAPLGCSH